MKKEHLQISLVVLILLGVFLRFYDLGGEYLWHDEKPFFVGALKIHNQNYVEGALFLREYPPLSKFVAGLPTVFINSDYNVLKVISSNMYVWEFIAFEALQSTYVAMRIMTAIIGTLGVLFTFLIGRRIFGAMAGLWGALLIALSFDMIALSRHGFPDIFLVGFGFMTLYFYMKYLEQEDTGWRIFFMFVTMVSLVLTLGSRPFHPLLMIPALLLSQWIVNKGRKNLVENSVFSALVILSIVFMFFVLYPEPARELAQEQYGVASPATVMGFTIHESIGYILIRNSYLFMIGAILFVFYAVNLARKHGIAKKVKEYISSNKRDLLIMVIFLLVAFFGTGFSKFVAWKYQAIVYMPLFVFGGYALNKASENKWLLLIFGVVVAVNTYQLISTFPYITEYPNFGIERFSGHTLDNDKRLVDEVLTELKNMGNPPILSNHLNTLFFYEGKKDKYVMPVNDNRCNAEYFKQFKGRNAYIVYSGEDIMNDQYMCREFGDLKVEKVKEITTGYGLKIYKMS